MQTYYKNQLYTIIDKLKLDPSLFEMWEKEEEGKLYTIIQIKDSDLRFTTVDSPINHDRFAYKHSLNRPVITETNFRQRLYQKSLFVKTGGRGYYKFRTVRKAFRRWLKRELASHFRDLRQENLWGALMRQEPIFQHDYTTNERLEYFDEEEKVEVRKALMQARDEVKEKLTLNELDLQELNDKIDYLIDSVERLNKFDWKSVLLTSTIDIATNIGLDPTGGKMVFDIFKDAFGIIPKLLGK